MSVYTYDIKGMKSAATSVRTEMSKYKNAMDQMTEIVEGTKNFYKDDRQRQYLTKYKEMSPAMEEVRKAMESYATFLEDTATYLDKQSKKEI